MRASAIIWYVRMAYRVVALLPGLTIHTVTELCIAPVLAVVFDPLGGHDELPAAATLGVARARRPAGAADALSERRARVHDGGARGASPEPFTRAGGGVL